MLVQLPEHRRAGSGCRHRKCAGVCDRAAWLEAGKPPMQLHVLLLQSRRRTRAKMLSRRWPGQNSRRKCRPYRRRAIASDDAHGKIPQRCVAEAPAWVHEVYPKTVVTRDLHKDGPQRSASATDSHQAGAWRPVGSRTFKAGAADVYRESCDYQSMRRGAVVIRCRPYSLLDVSSVARVVAVIFNRSRKRRDSDTSQRRKVQRPK